MPRAPRPTAQGRGRSARSGASPLHHVRRPLAALRWPDVEEWTQSAGRSRCERSPVGTGRTATPSVPPACPAHSQSVRVSRCVVSTATRPVRVGQISGGRGRAEVKPTKSRPASVTQSGWYEQADSGTPSSRAPLNSWLHRMSSATRAYCRPGATVYRSAPSDRAASRSPSRSSWGTGDVRNGPRCVCRLRRARFISSSAWLALS